MTLAWPTHPIKYYLYLPQQSAIATRHINRKQYELTDHLGNVRVVISDAKHLDIRPTGYIDEPLITSYSNYYSFGMQMPSVNFSGSNYRYGFNGKENDSEVASTGQGTQDYGMRIYNPSLGRFLSIDPLFRTYPHYSPYQFAGNSPIAFIDLDGLERVLAITFNSDVNYRAQKLEVANEGEISKKVLTTNPATQLANAFVEASAADKNGIGFVAIWGHGSPNNMWGSDSNSLDKDDLGALRTAVANGEVDFTDNAIIYIGNCNAGTLDANGRSFAQELADITGATVIAGSTDNYDDPNRLHRGSVGKKDEKNGNLKYTMWYPKLDNFKEYNAGEQPSQMSGEIDVKYLMMRGKSLPLEKMKSREASPLTVNIPEPTLKK
jgi:RHS repeat-associated protein